MLGDVVRWLQVDLRGDPLEAERQFRAFAKTYFSQVCVCVFCVLHSFSFAKTYFSQVCVCVCVCSLFAQTHSSQVCLCITQRVVI